MIDMASVYAERFKSNPNALRAAVMGQSPDPKLDPYTALNALKLVKESQMAAMAGQAQQPTSAPSILAQNLAPPAPPQGLAGMVPMGAPAGQMPQGMPPQQRAPIPQPVMQAASGGLASLPTTDEDYCGGGIVAFAKGGGAQLGSEVSAENDYQQETDDEGYSDSQGRSIDANGNLIDDTDVDTGGGASRPVQRRAFAAQDLYAKFDPEEMTAKQQEEFLDRYEARMKKSSGPDIYAPARERQAAREAAIAGDRRTGEGLAYLTAAGAVLKGRNLAEGASNALPAYAQQLGEVKRAENQEKRSIEQMNFALNDAERKERMGNQRGAQSALESARKFQQDANKAKADKLRYGADLATRNVQYDRLANKGAGSGPKYQEQILQNNIDYFKSTLKPKPNETPEAFDARVRKTASDEAAARLKTSYSTGEIGGLNAATRLAPVQANIDTKVNEALQKFKSTDSAGSAYRAALRKKDTEGANSLLQAEENRLRGVFQKSEAAAGNAPAPAAAPKPTATSKVLSQADFEATITGSIAKGKTRQEAIDALKANGYTVK